MTTTSPRQNSNDVNESPLQSPPKNYVNLLNFDPHGKEENFLTSPRSKEACQRQGILEKELLIKDKKDHAKEPIPKLFLGDPNGYLEAKTAYFEQERLSKLQVLIKTRETIIEYEKKKHEHNSSYDPQGKAMNISCHTETSYYEQEKKKLENLKRKQEMGLKQMIETEKRRSESAQKTELKMRRIDDMLESRRKEIEQKRQESELAAARRSQMKEEEYQRQNKLLLEALELKKQQEEQHKQRQASAEAKRELEAAERDQKRKEKAAILVKRIEETNKKRMEELEVKRETMQHRQKELEEMNEAKRKENILAAAMKREQFERKMQTVLEIQKELLQEKVEKIEEKKLLAEENLRRFEIKQREKVEKRRERNVLKSMEIKRAIEVKDKEQAEREARITEAGQRAEQVHARLMKELEISRKIKIEKERAHENEVQLRHEQRLVLIEQSLSAKLNELNVSMAQATEKRNELFKTLPHKKYLDYFREEEARATQERKQRMIEYRSQKLKEKEEQERQRLEERARERDAIIREKQKIKKEFEKEREKIQEDAKRNTFAMFRSSSLGNILQTNQKTQEGDGSVVLSTSQLVKSTEYYLPKLKPNQSSAALRSKSSGRAVIRASARSEVNSAKVYNISLDNNKSVFAKTAVLDRNSKGKEEAANLKKTRSHSLASLFFINKDDVVFNGLSGFKWYKKLKKDQMRDFLEQLNRDQAMYDRTSNENFFKQSAAKLLATAKKQVADLQTEIDKEDAFQIKDALSKIIIRK